MTVTVLENDIISKVRAKPALAVSEGKSHPLAVIKNFINLQKLLYHIKRCL